MIELNMNTADFEEFLRNLNELEVRQLPFALSKALTQSAIDSRNHTRDQMRKIFDRPRPYTINSMLISAARKDRLEAKVYYDETKDHGTPASEYLKPNTFGGARLPKKSETQLRKAGVIGDNEFIIPSAAVPRDQYGNARTSEIIRILSAFRATFDTKQRSAIYGKTNDKSSRRKGIEYILGYSMSGTRRLNAETKKGKTIFKRTPSGLIPMYFITNHAPVYKPIFSFEDIVKSKFNECIGSNFNAAFEYAMRTAKLKK